MTRLFILFNLAVLLFIFSANQAHAFPMPDTGQISCYNLIGDVIPCQSCPPATSLCGQDAQYQPRLPRTYSKLGEEGQVLPDSEPHVDNGGNWIMTKDEVTGLIWEVKTNMGPSFHHKDNTYDISEAQNIFIKNLNSQKFGGFDDWRLPDVRELSSLVNSEISWPGGPTIDLFYFPNTTSLISSYYWSATPVSGSLLSNWYVSYYYGHVNHALKSQKHHVRAVRGHISAPQIIDNGDGTVTDTASGLMWSLCNAGQSWDGTSCDETAVPLDWEGALSYAEQLEVAGYSDWRLPDRNELQSLIDYNRRNQAIDLLLNMDTQANFYWSSTTVAHNPSYAWRVNFSSGYVRIFNKTNGHYVRAVRSGQEKCFGELRVNIMPVSARNEGAKWRPSGTSIWYESDQKITIAEGEYLIEFMNVPNLRKPQHIDETVNCGSTSVVSANYTPEPGRLQVIIEPHSVNAEGAKWRRTGQSEWLNSNAIEEDIPAGAHDIEFKSVPGWLEPSPVSVSIVSGGLSTAAGRYEQLTSLSFITLDANGNQIAGAWRRAGQTTWQNSASVETGVRVNNYTVEFSSINRYITPDNVSLSLPPISQSAVTASVGYAIYQPINPGQLTVTILPEAAVTDGVQWRRQGTFAWFDSEEIENNVPAGTYNIEFKRVSGWISSGPVQATVVKNETTHIPPVNLRRNTMPWLMLLL